MKVQEGPLSPDRVPQWQTRLGSSLSNSNALKTFNKAFFWYVWCGKLWTVIDYGNSTPLEDATIFTRTNVAWSNILFSLGLGQNQRFGPKQNTNFGVSTTHHPPTTHHLPKTFWRVLGIVEGQDLVCRLPIVQGTSAHSFESPPPQIFLTQKYFGSKIFGTDFFY